VEMERKFIHTSWRSTPKPIRQTSYHRTHVGHIVTRHVTRRPF
jgi:hypothetical protein